MSEHKSDPARRYAVLRALFADLQTDYEALQMQWRDREAHLMGQINEAVALLEMWHQEYHPQPALKDCCATQQFLDRLK